MRIFSNHSRDHRATLQATQSSLVAPHNIATYVKRLPCTKLVHETVNQGWYHKLTIFVTPGAPGAMLADRVLFQGFSAYKARFDCGVDV